MRRKLNLLFAVLLIGGLILSACVPQQATEPEEEQVEEAVAEETTEEEPEEETAAEEVTDEEEEEEEAVEETTEEGPCLTIGATYGGPINDAGYNQAMHESVMAIKQNIDCVEIIEAENVYDEAGATTTIEQMIQQGANMIIATAFSHQYPALDLAAKYPDVIFEHAGGWEMSDNFANFFGKPPDVWYAKGVAAGLMTETDRLGFVAAFPLGWTLTFANAFYLGAKSVNPDAVVEVQFTYNWGDSAKEAEVTNALINSGADVITMHVDSPATVISTAESRGVFSIGFQSLAAQQFAPENWIVGSGFTLGGKLTWLASTVIDGTWSPIFLRCSLKEGCMALSEFGSLVPQEVQDTVLQVVDELDAGTIVAFAGPISDQDGNIVVEEGDVLTDDLMMTNVAALGAGVLAISLIFLAAGVNPLYAVSQIFFESFGSVYGIKETITKAIPLILIGAGLTLAFRAKFWNIGAEGQLLMGAIFATWTAQHLGNALPSAVIVPLIFTAGFIGGALWGIIRN